MRGLVSKFRFDEGPSIRPYEPSPSRGKENTSRNPPIPNGNDTFGAGSPVRVRFEDEGKHSTQPVMELQLLHRSMFEEGSFNNETES